MAGNGQDGGCRVDRWPGNGPGTAFRWHLCPGVARAPTILFVSASEVVSSRTGPGRAWRQDRRRQTPRWPHRGKSRASERSYFWRLRSAETGIRPIPLDRRYEPDRRRRVGWRAVRTTADTNVLVRAIAGDDPRQNTLGAIRTRGCHAHRGHATMPVRIGLGLIARLLAPHPADRGRHPAVD